MSTYITTTTSPNILIKMAQTAASNSMLMAHFIENQCQQREITWAELAAELQISDAQLAKLALCRQPRKDHFAEDVAQTVRYTKIEAQTVGQFLQPASKLAFIKKFFRQKRPSLPNNNRKGDQPMIIKRALAFGMALIAIFFMSAFIFSQPASADATLRVTSGEVVVQQTSIFNQATTIAVSSGETLTVSSKDTIEVQDGAVAVLYLFEGSTVELSENTVLELTELTNNGSDHQIYMTLFNGHIINRVTKLLGVNDAYEVRTPSSTASVRGTVFSVEVLNENAAMVNVTEGVVEVNLGNEVAQVHAGEMITAVSGQPLNVEPSNNPEMRPTATPTQEPTKEPTKEPTQSPTDAPADTLDAETVEESEANDPNGNRPENTPGNENGNRPETPPGQGKDNKNGNPPDTVPGNPPEDVPGNGNSPAGGGTPPGQENNPNNGVNNGNNGNTGNQGSDNADAGSGNADNGGNTDNQGSDNADAGSGNANNGGNNGSDNADNGSGNSGNGNGGNGNGNNGNGKP